MQQINEQGAVKTKGRLTSTAEKMLMSRGGYLADRLYYFTHKKNTVSLNHNIQSQHRKLHWLILAREHYFETSKEYPIANKKDLTQALRFEESIAPFDGLTLTFIQRLDEQTHKVTFWVVNPQILLTLDTQPWLILPESYLLAKSLTKNQNIIAIARMTVPIYIAKIGQNITSGVQSVNTPDLETFAIASGSTLEQNNNNEIQSEHLETKGHNGNGFSTLLHQCIQSTNIVELKNFIRKPNAIEWQSYPWKKAGVLIVSVLSLYLVLTSTWLAFNEYRIAHQLNEQSKRVNEALAVQKQYRLQEEWSQVLSQPFNDLKPYWNTWHVVLNIVEMGAEIKSVHYKQGEITIQGKAKKGAKATDILVKLNALNVIESPRFTSPVRNSRGQEEFTISFGFTTVAPNKIVDPLIKQVKAQGSPNAASK